MMDIQINNHGELAISGDFDFGESAAQEQLMLLLHPQGSWKERPDVGIGIIRYVEGENPAGLQRQVRQQMASDGQDSFFNNKLNSIQIHGG